MPEHPSSIELSPTPPEAGLGEQSFALIPPDVKQAKQIELSAKGYTDEEISRVFELNEQRRDLEAELAKAQTQAEQADLAVAANRVDATVQASVKAWNRVKEIATQLGTRLDSLSAIKAGWAKRMKIELEKERKASPDFLSSSFAALQDRLSSRAAEFGLTPPTLETPVLPESFTPEHLEAMAEVFGEDNLEPLMMPAPEQLTDDYFAMMYPATQREEDTARGLTSFHPDFWDKEADKSIVGPASETWGQAYIRSLIAEAEQFRGKVLFTESIQKPKYIDGSQQYGTADGLDASQDPLLPLIQKVFGEEANRFNLTWDQIDTQLLPKVKKLIQAKFKEQGLPDFDFEVVCTPAVVSNLQTTLNHPENSGTNTDEWTSTPLLKQDGADGGRRLLVGDSGHGGAGCVYGGRRGRGWVGGGFRLSVVSAKSK